MTYDAIVIGAGAAGLAALRELHGAGLSVVCIEALGRIGGRIYTVHDPASPDAIELGAEFVHGRPREIFDIVEEAGLKSAERSHEIQPASVGERTDSGAMWRVMAAMERAAESGPDESFAAFAERAPFDSAAKRAATRFVEGFNAAHAGIVSIHALAQESKAADAIEGDRAFHLLNGYDGVAHAMLPRGAELRLHIAAERIAWKPGEVVVHTRSTTDGTAQEIKARRAVITVSLGVLQGGGITFDPEPSGALEAARALAFGQVMRVTVRFDQMPSFFRPGFLFSSEPVFPTWWTSLPTQAPIITGWSAGPKADALVDQSEDAIIDAALESLRRITGAQALPVAATYFHNWHADPCFRGAYSYVPAGKLAARAALAEPVENTLYFAGEAADFSGHAATVHGAIISGRHAAQLVLAPRGTQ